MKIGFQHPYNGVPCIAEWEEENETLEFYLEDAEYVAQFYPSEEIDEIEKWCEGKMLKCVSEEDVDNHLNFFGIKDR